MEIDLSGLPPKIRSKVQEMSANLDFERIISRGANGHVLIASSRILQRRIAVKFYYWGNGDHAEPANLAQMQSDYILPVLHAEALDDDDAYFTTPFCEHGDLDDVMSKGALGPLEAVDALLQIASGVNYLHAERYLHRDLKPTNIFCIAPRRLVIGDFGSVARQNAENFVQTITRHALLYRPPEEILEKRCYEQSDIYQLGIVFFQLLGGRLPYEEIAWLSKSQRQAYEAKTGLDRQFYASEIIEDRIIRGRIVDLATLPPWTPKPLITLIRKCLKIDKAQRFSSAADLIAKLNNIRGTLPDWRKLDEAPILYRGRAKFQIVKDKKGLHIEKMVNGATNWRRLRGLKPNNIEEAIEMAEAQ